MKSRTLSGMKPIKPQKCKFDSIDCTPTCKYYKTCVHSLHKQAGVLELLRIEEDCSQDFPVEKVRSTGMHIWYRELSVFDTTRAKLSADGIEVTMKISIPQYKQVNSKCICVIDGAQHEIYNVAHVTTKDGFKETELTLKTPAYDREVYDDETGTQ